MNTTFEKLLDSSETVERLTKNVLLYPIAKCMLHKHESHYDLINTYENAMSHIEDIVSVQAILDEPLHCEVDNTLIKFKFWINNVRIYGPNTVEHKLYSVQFAKVSSPNEALMYRKTYCALLLGDINYSYSIISAKDGTETENVTTTLKDKWNVNIPIPIGCKWCTLRNYDPLTLVKSGEDFEGAYGYFIVAGFLKYLIPIYQKPFNMPIIRHNEYDNQKSRCECLYSSGLDYENSYYVIASMIQPKQSHIGRGASQIPIVDFIFSLQMNDAVMNQEQIISRKKTLVNSVPIKYLFWAFGCRNDEEMIKYICPDMNDFGLIHTIRQACLEGDSHISAVKGIVEFSVQRGFIHFKNSLDMITARYIIGSIILSVDYKKHIREKCKDDVNQYKLEIIRQTNRLLRTKFMPGVGKMSSDQTLYDIPAEQLTSEQQIVMDNQEKTRNKAICFELGNIIRDLYLIGNGITPSMDRISLLNKRIRSGQQIEREFKSFNNARMREVKVEMEQFFKNYKDLNSLKGTAMKKDMDGKILALSRKINVSQSTSLLNSFKGVATKDKSKMRTNMLSLKNQSFLNACLREIVISTEQKAQGTGVQWEHRVVHPSHLYFVDPVYCPESGPQVGRYQQPTLYTFLTNGSLGRDILELIQKHPGYQRYSETIDDKYVIKLNGSTIGYIDQYDPIDKLYASLMEARRLHKIVSDCSVTLKHLTGILDIWCDEGRLITCFVSVKNCFETAAGQIAVRPNFIEWLNECDTSSNPTKAYERGLREGFVELFDASMTVYNTTVAPTMLDYYAEPWKYGHIALPLHTLSYVTAINPSTPLNAGVRASYSSNHMKQAIGPTLRYPQLKYINEANVLLSPQIPLIRPVAYDFLHYDDKPMGENITIAFLMYTDNQEDSFIINRSSIENGCFVIDSYYVATAECQKQDESFKIPDELTPKNGNPESYLKLDPITCLPRQVGDRFYENDVLIAKTVQLNSNDIKKNDRSTLNSHPDACHPRVANTRELRCVGTDTAINLNDKFKMAVFGQRRVPISGDKFNSTNAQKGTVGRVYDSNMMPYTANGLKPDIIFNPPSIFKRNTCGQLYEPAMCKLAALLGCPMDVTPYATMRNTEEIDAIYEQLGLDKFGYEILYDPESGRKMGQVFVGVMQMQRQQHLVENKLNVRAGEGDIDRISGLPVKGRKRAGGQAVDRMSVDSLNASGAVMLNRDIHLEQGAKMSVAICNKCKRQFTYYSKEYKCWFCTTCGRHSDFTIKEVVPAQNLINHILTGMQVCMEYRTEDDEKDIIKDMYEEIA